MKVCAQLQQKYTDTQLLDYLFQFSDTPYRFGSRSEIIRQIECERSHPPECLRKFKVINSIGSGFSGMEEIKFYCQICGQHLKDHRLFPQTKKVIKSSKNLTSKCQISEMIHPGVLSKASTNNDPKIHRTRLVWNCCSGRVREKGCTVNPYALEPTLPRLITTKIWGYLTLIHSKNT
jgi:hypothetical protein